MEAWLQGSRLSPIFQFFTKYHPSRFVTATGVPTAFSQDVVGGRYRSLRSASRATLIVGTSAGGLSTLLPRAPPLCNPNPDRAPAKDY